MSGTISQFYPLTPDRGPQPSDQKSLLTGRAPPAAPRPQPVFPPFSAMPSGPSRSPTRSGWKGAPCHHAAGGEDQATGAASCAPALSSPFPARARMPMKNLSRLDPAFPPTRPVPTDATEAASRWSTGRPGPPPASLERDLRLPRREGAPSPRAHRPPGLL